MMSDLEPLILDIFPMPHSFNFYSLSFHLWNFHISFIVWISPLSFFLSILISILLFLTPLLSLCFSFFLFFFFSILFFFSHLSFNLSVCFSLSASFLHLFPCFSSLSIFKPIYLSFCLSQFFLYLRIRS